MADHSNGHHPDQNPLGEDETGKQCTFEEWLTLVFDYPPVSWHEYSELSDARLMETGCFFGADQIIDHYIRLFENLTTHLAPYTLRQIGQALYALVGMGHEFVWAFGEDDVPLGRRKQAFRLMYNVYEQIFEPYCEPVLRRYTAKETDDDDSALNSVCFLWWDMGIPMFDEDEREPDPDSMNGTAIGVMERVLANLTNPACWESALHGLGHYQRFDPPRIRAAIDAFLAAHPDLDPRLREYANAARYGAVL